MSTPAVRRIRPTNTAPITAPYDRQLSTPRLALVRATVAAKRAQHPELAGAELTLAQLRALVGREQIELLETRSATGAGWLGCTHAFEGDCVITLRRGLTARVQRVVLAHELGHCWLHVGDPVVMAWRAAEIRHYRELHPGCQRPSRDQWPQYGPIYQRCEDEADLVAAELLGVPVQIIEAVVRTANEALA